MEVGAKESPSTGEKRPAGIAPNYVVHDYLFKFNTRDRGNAGDNTVFIDQITHKHMALFFHNEEKKEAFRQNDWGKYFDENLSQQADEISSAKTEFLSRIALIKGLLDDEKSSARSHMNMTPVKAIPESHPQKSAYPEQIFELKKQDDKYYFIPTAKGVKKAPVAEGIFAFVIVPDDPDRIYCGMQNGVDLKGKKYPRLCVEGHTSLTDNKPVLFAGGLLFKNDKLEFWNNGSGHYRPDAELRFTNFSSNVHGLLPENLFHDIRSMTEKEENDWKAYRKRAALDVSSDSDRSDSSDSDIEKRIIDEHRSRWRQSGLKGGNPIAAAKKTSSDKGLSHLLNPVWGVPGTLPAKGGLRGGNPETIMDSVGAAACAPIADSVPNNQDHDASLAASSLALGEQNSVEALSSQNVAKDVSHAFHASSSIPRRMQRRPGLKLNIPQPASKEKIASELGVKPIQASEISRILDDIQDATNSTFAVTGSVALNMYARKGNLTFHRTVNDLDLITENLPQFISDLAKNSAFDTSHVNSSEGNGWIIHTETNQIFDVLEAGSVFGYLTGIEMIDDTPVMPLQSLEENLKAQGSKEADLIFLNSLKKSRQMSDTPRILGEFKPIRQLLSTGCDTQSARDNARIAKGVFKEVREADERGNKSEEQENVGALSSQNAGQSLTADDAAQRLRAALGRKDLKEVLQQLARLQAATPADRAEILRPKDGKHLLQELSILIMNNDNFGKFAAILLPECLKALPELVDAGVMGASEAMKLLVPSAGPTAPPSVLACLAKVVAPYAFPKAAADQFLKTVHVLKSQMPAEEIGDLRDMLEKQKERIDVRIPDVRPEPKAGLTLPERLKSSDIVIGSREDTKAFKKRLEEAELLASPFMSKVRSILGLQQSGPTPLDSSASVGPAFSEESMRELTKLAEGQKDSEETEKRMKNAVITDPYANAAITARNANAPITDLYGFKPGERDAIRQLKKDRLQAESRQCLANVNAQNTTLYEQQEQRYKADKDERDARQTAATHARTAAFEAQRREGAAMLLGGINAISDNVVAIRSQRAAQKEAKPVRMLPQPPGPTPPSLASGPRQQIAAARPGSVAARRSAALTEIGTTIAVPGNTAVATRASKPFTPPDSYVDLEEGAVKIPFTLPARPNERFEATVPITPDTRAVFAHIPPRSDPPQLLQMGSEKRLAVLTEQHIGPRFVKAQFSDANGSGGKLEIAVKHNPGNPIKVKPPTESIIDIVPTKPALR